MGAVLNIGAVANVLRAAWPEQVLIVCAGTFSDFALEDACAAGLLIGYLGAESLSDSAHAALAVTRLYSEPLAAIRASRNGRVLMGTGRQADVEWCSQLSRYDVVGEMQSSVVRPLAS